MKGIVLPAKYVQERWNSGVKFNTGFRDEWGMDSETSRVRFMHKFGWLQ
jgi:hypothetical protein